MAPTMNIYMNMEILADNVGSANYGLVVLGNSLALTLRTPAAVKRDMQPFIAFGCGNGQNIDKQEQI